MVTVAFDTIDGKNVITIFIEAAMDPVGHEDRTKDLTNENYDEKLRSKNSVKAFPSEARDEIITRRSRLTVVHNNA